MSDCCEDKTSNYDIRPEDERLIRAAIGFGETIIALETASKEQKKATSEMIAFLESLPAPPPPGFHGEFGFRVEATTEEDEEAGHSGSWFVCVCRSMFEIFSSDREKSAGFSWILCPGQKNYNSMADAEKWISEVEDPAILFLPTQKLVVDCSTWSVSNDKSLT